MLNELPVQLVHIKQKLQQLLKQQQHVEKENRQLKEALQKKEKQLQTSQEKVAQLEQQVTALRLSGSKDLSETDRLDVQKKIDGYLKEIDKCLALLNT